MKLLYKELALAAHPSLFVFMSLGCLVIVPSYPYTVIFLFGCLAPFLTFMFARENNDAWYTAMLPVTKKEIVKGKFQLILFAQIGQLLIALIFTLLRGLLKLDNNPLGMDPTAAWYGCGLVTLSVFNLIFFPTYYQSGYKAGISFLCAIVPAALLAVAAEISVHLPSLAWLDSFSPGQLFRQLPLLLAGILCYCLGMMLAYRISAKRFEQVNL